jgi:hypothetical protein
MFLPKNGCPASFRLGKGMGHADTQVRARMQLCHVYICTLDALFLLSDNFDYQSIAGDLIPGVLSEQELGGSLHMYELARVSKGMQTITCIAWVLGSETFHIYLPTYAGLLQAN